MKAWRSNSINLLPKHLLCVTSFDRKNTQQPVQNGQRGAPKGTILLTLASHQGTGDPETMVAVTPCTSAGAGTLRVDSDAALIRGLGVASRGSLCCRKRVSLLPCKRTCVMSQEDILGLFVNVLVDDFGFRDMFGGVCFTAGSNPMTKTAGTSSHRDEGSRPSHSRAWKTRREMRKRRRGR